LARLLVVLHHLVVEDGEVEGETQFDGVARVQALSCRLRLLIVLECAVAGLCEDVPLGRLSHVPVVVTDHLEEEGAALRVTRLHTVLLDHVYDVLAVLLELTLDLLLVVAECSTELLVLRILLNR